MSRILAFRHVPFEGMGLIELALEAHQIHFDYADLYDHPSPPADPSEYDALIFMGGPMSVNDDLPYLRREEEYIRQAIGRGVPVLGVCLGSQLIAHALGAEVRRNAVKEIGWFEVELTEAGRNDPVFEAFRSIEPVFHWHGETFDLPPGAELLASSERCRNQAFRLGAAVYGMQFHLEITPAMIADWCVEDENCGDIRELGATPDPYAHAPRMEQLAAAAFGRWADIVRRITNE
jgi:GMP synthase-like glutamine amidotransferase